MDIRDFAQEAQVVDRDGTMIGTLLTFDEASEPPSFVMMHARDGRHVRIPASQVDREASSAQRIVVDVPGDALLASSASDVPGTGAEPAAATGTALAAEEHRHLTVPLLQEDLEATTRDVEKGRVVIRKRVETVPVEQSIAVAHDEVDVERVAVGRDVAGMPEIRYEGDTMIVPVVEEVLVVEKRLRLVEELRVTKRRVTEERVVREEVRREVVDVESADAGLTAEER